MIGLGLRLRRRAERRVTGRRLAAATASLLSEGRPLREGIAHPAPVVGESLLNRADASEQPRFTRAAQPAPPTRPIPGLAPVEAVVASRAARARAVRPYVSAGAPKTLVFDTLAAELPLPPAMSAGDVARLLGRAPASPSGAPGCDVELYSADGWAHALAARRVATGEWDDWLADVERGLGRNAAEEATAIRHSRQGVAEGWRRFCLAVGHPEWTDPGLTRIHELVMQDRKGTGPQPAVAGGAA